MSDNVLLRFLRSIGLGIGLFVVLCLSGLPAAAAKEGAATFSPAGYDDVFCGSALPMSRPARVVLPPHKGAVTVDISIFNTAFNPPDLTINVGDTVRWTNNDGRAHTSTSDSLTWDSGTLNPGNTFSFTFTSAGAFPFHCNFHPSMTGTITVQAGGPSVDISGFAFNPQDLTINVGDTVTWTNNDPGSHTTTSDSAVWDSGALGMGQTFSFQFTSPGVFPYHCNIHPSMTGTITVLGGPTDTPTDTPTNTPTNAPTNTPTNTNTATPTPAGTPSISGVVTYGLSAATPTPKYISGAALSATGSVPLSGMTGPAGPTAGQYTLTGFGSGPYAVYISKTNQTNGISSNDAARVAQHVAGISGSVFTTTVQSIAADVSNNGSVSSNDAAKVAQFAAGITPLPSPNASGTWKFFKPNPNFPISTSQTYRTYPAGVTGPITGQDFWGVLCGEVTNSWSASGPRPIKGPERSMAVELPNLTSENGKTIVITVHVQGAANKEIISYEFDLRYDPSVIQPLADSVDIKRTASRALSYVINPAEPGLLRVVMYGPLPIDGNYVLLNLRFTAVGTPGWVSPLTFERLMFNEGEPVALITDGRVELF